MIKAHVELYGMSFFVLKLTLSLGFNKIYSSISIRQLIQPAVGKHLVESNKCVIDFRAIMRYTDNILTVYCQYIDIRSNLIIKII